MGNESAAAQGTSLSKMRLRSRARTTGGGEEKVAVFEGDNEGGSNKKADITASDE